MSPQPGRPRQRAHHNLTSTGPFIKPSRRALRSSTPITSKFSPAFGGRLDVAGSRPSASPSSASTPTRALGHIALRLTSWDSARPAQAFFPGRGAPALSGVRYAGRSPPIPGALTLAIPPRSRSGRRAPDRRCPSRCTISRRSPSVHIVYTIPTRCWARSSMSSPPSRTGESCSASSPHRASGLSLAVLAGGGAVPGADTRLPQLTESTIPRIPRTC